MIGSVDWTTRGSASLDEERFGGYNDRPPNMVEISAEGLAKGGGFPAEISKIEHRYFSKEPVDGFAAFGGRPTALSRAVLLFNLTKRSGIVILSDYWADPSKGGKPIRYFQWHWKYEPPCQIVSDPKCWSLNQSTSMPHRGINDYERYIHFERDLNESEVEDLRYWLSTDECPGWTGVSISRTSPGVYRCCTTYDSSD